MRHQQLSDRDSYPRWTSPRSDRRAPKWRRCRRRKSRAHAPDDVHRIPQPTWFERAVIIGVQWIFYLFFFALYLISSKTAHRVVGYFEEEAVISYTHYLAEIDEGRSENVPAPAIARRYWGLPDDATLRDVVLVVRADAAHHGDVNHGFANELAGLPQGEVAPCPPHAALEPIWKQTA